MWRLFYPLKYFLLHNKEKRRIDLWPTLLLAIMMALPYILLKDAEFFAAGGFLDKIIPLSSALTAFYVAALVAVATFSHADLDKVITLGSIYLLEEDEKGNKRPDYLTRRQFACIIFGYLSFLSLIISIGAALAVTVGTTTVNDLAVGEYVIDASRLLNGTWIFVFCAAVSHMVTVTCLGLYYLMDRIHDRDPRILTKKPDPSA